MGAISVITSPYEQAVIIGKQAPQLRVTLKATPRLLSFALLFHLIIEANAPC
jgi:hypothetical protein